MRGSVGVDLLGGVCAGTGGADGEVASYGGGGAWNTFSKKHTSLAYCISIRIIFTFKFDHVCQKYMW